MNQVKLSILLPSVGELLCRLATNKLLKTQIAIRSWTLHAEIRGPFFAHAIELSLYTMMLYIKDDLRHDT